MACSRMGDMHGQSHEVIPCLIRTIAHVVPEQNCLTVFSMLSLDFIFSEFASKREIIHSVTTQANWSWALLLPRNQEIMGNIRHLQVQERK